MTTPWYADGLPFECTQCGDCCTGAPGFVWVDEAELQAIADYLQEPIEEVRALYTSQQGKRRTLREKSNYDCIFLDDNRACTIYPVRPKQCRTWPFWESNLQSEDTWKETCQTCPGAGEGGLIPVEEITRRMKEIRI